MTRLFMNNELEKMRKEVVMVLLEVLFLHLPGGTEENHKSLLSG
jgi:hypothetical protein